MHFCLGEQQPRLRACRRLCDATLRTLATSPAPPPLHAALSQPVQFLPPSLASSLSSLPLTPSPQQSGHSAFPRARSSPSTSHSEYVTAWAPTNSLSTIPTPNASPVTFRASPGRASTLSSAPRFHSALATSRGGGGSSQPSPSSLRPSLFRPTTSLSKIQFVLEAAARGQRTLSPPLPCPGKSSPPPAALRPITPVSLPAPPASPPSAWLQEACDWLGPIDHVSLRSHSDLAQPSTAKADPLRTVSVHSYAPRSPSSGIVAQSPGPAFAFRMMDSDCLGSSLGPELPELSTKTTESDPISSLPAASPFTPPTFLTNV